MPEQRSARETWERMKSDHLNAPDLLSEDAQALCSMGDSLRDIALDVVEVFQKHVAQMKERYKRSSSSMQRFGVALGTPLPLVRVLSSCGTAARAAKPSLKKYRRFLFWHMGSLILEGFHPAVLRRDISQVKQAIKNVGGGGLLSLFKGK